MFTRSALLRVGCCSERMMTVSKSLDVLMEFSVGIGSGVHGHCYRFAFGMGSYYGLSLGAFFYVASRLGSLVAWSLFPLPRFSFCLHFLHIWILGAFDTSWNPTSLWA